MKPIHKELIIIHFISVPKQQPHGQLQKTARNDDDDDDDDNNNNNNEGGLDSSVDTAIRYGLVGPGIESQWGRDFPHPSRPALRPTRPPVQWVPGLSRG